MSAETFDANEHSRRYAAVDILVALIGVCSTDGEITLADALADMARDALGTAAVIFPVSIEEAEDPEPAAREEGAKAERARIRQMALDRAQEIADIPDDDRPDPFDEHGDIAVQALRDFAALLEKP